MRSRDYWRSALPFLALGVLACADQTTAPERVPDDSAAVADAEVPSESPEEEAATPAPSAGSRADGGRDGSAASDASSAAPKDAGKGSVKEDAFAMGADAASADGGVRQVPDGGSTTPPVDAPAAVAAPMIWGFGLGITDAPGAVKFYSDVMKMTAEMSDVKRDDRTETIMYASQAKKGARIALMRYDDMRNTRKITAKLVFQAANTRAVNSAAALHPGYVSRLNIGIVQFDGPETYVHEVGSIFDSGSNVDVPYPIAMGFAVSDLTASRKFYTALGMSESRTGSFAVTDATGSGNITEYTVKFAMGSGLVLQQWSPMRNTKDNPIKVILMVPDARAMAEKVVAAGGAMVKPAERLPAYQNRLVVVANDPDGYLLDLVQ